MNIPDKIYLQTEDEYTNSLDEGEMTWSMERIFESDVEYVKAKPEDNNNG